MNIFVYKLKFIKHIKQLGKILIIKSPIDAIKSTERFDTMSTIKTFNLQSIVKTIIKIGTEKHTAVLVIVNSHKTYSLLVNV